MVILGYADGGAGRGAGEDGGIAEALASGEGLGEAVPDEEGAAGEGGAVLRPVDVAALGEADEVDAVGSEGGGGADAAEVRELAVDNDIGNRPEVALAKEGAVDGGRGAEALDEGGEGFAPADASGGDGGRDGDAPVVEVRVDDMELDAADAPAGIGDGLGRACERGGRDEQQQCRYDEEPTVQSRMSSRFQPNASSKQSLAIWVEGTASLRSAHQTSSGVMVWPAGGKIPA